METTGQQIFKRLSGQVANVGSVIGNVKHGIEDMKKANQAAQAEIESRQVQKQDFQDRLEGVSNPETKVEAQPQVQEPQAQVEAEVKGGK